MTMRAVLEQLLFRWELKLTTIDSELIRQAREAIEIDDAVRNSQTGLAQCSHSCPLRPIGPGPAMAEPTEPLSLEDLLTQMKL